MFNNRIQTMKGKASHVCQVGKRDKYRIVAAKEKKRAQEAQDKVVGKRPGRVGTSGRAKKRKIAPLSMALSDSEADGSPQGASEISDVRAEEEAEDASNNNDDNTKEVNSPHSALYPHLKRSLHSEHSLHFEEAFTTLSRNIPQSCKLPIMEFIEM
ncbi:hypothetical protein Tco_0308060 [Tanacetum coccineum]